LMKIMKRLELTISVLKDFQETIPKIIMKNLHQIIGSPNHNLLTKSNPSNRINKSLNESSLKNLLSKINNIWPMHKNNGG
jgi:hypothetical protein